MTENEIEVELSKLAGKNWLRGARRGGAQLIRQERKAAKKKERRGNRG